MFVGLCRDFNRVPPTQAIPSLMPPQLGGGGPGGGPGMLGVLALIVGVLEALGVADGEVVDMVLD